MENKNSTPAARRGGFTLIELMIVVAIIGILAAIALPRFADLVRKSQEANSKGNLASLRSALSVYYGDNEGQYPSRLASLTVAGEYLPAIGVAKTPNYHSDNSAEYDAILSAPNDGGNWLYDNTLLDANVGNMLVNCTHTDTKGVVWSSY